MPNKKPKRHSREAGSAREAAAPSPAREPREGDPLWQPAESRLELSLTPMEALPFVGCLEMAVVEGSVRLLGAEIHGSSIPIWHTLESPVGGLPLALQTPSAVSSPAHVWLRSGGGGGALRAHDGSEPEGNGTLPAELSDDEEIGAPPTAVPSLLVVEEEDGPEALEMEAAEDSAPPPMQASGSAPSVGLPASGATRLAGAVVEQLGCRVLSAAPSTARSGALVPEVWEEAAEALLAEVAAVHTSWRNAGTSGSAPASSATAPIILLCGARNQGKSSFCRFLLNRLIDAASTQTASSGGGPAEDAEDAGAAGGTAASGGSEGTLRHAGSDAGTGGEQAEVDAPVAFLECDVGQAEFSPCGALALHLVSSPVFGGPSSHLRPAHACRFFGSANPSTEPELYVQNVLRLIDEYRAVLAKARSPIPLVVNTCGWVTGLGLELLADVVAATAPTHLIVLEKGVNSNGRRPAHQPRHSQAPATHQPRTSHASRNRGLRRSVFCACYPLCPVHLSHLRSPVLSLAYSLAQHLTHPVPRPPLTHHPLAPAGFSALLLASLDPSPLPCLPQTARIASTRELRSRPWPPPPAVSHPPARAAILPHCNRVR